ncbi:MULTISPECIES: copper homeostasis membrane protein CopD [unclassified Rhizobium]|jgi:putative copper resistance protein D|uniref:copper homeostasis membrane protein CopD n=1 Tax=unclassified Rhizobium TaxID=2613769 RepID=UPI000647B85A|nr:MULTISPECIES: copper homeostasis membrane protein CopD [unclassified Rhizobium]MBN8953763.1 copper homeostasis membrane protein CopD [Rhizobium tropici]OJY72425.1 MAG: copper resistance protein CopD [Rhizobium sp. 60-20]RKD50831.1 putative copper resistance protein D [Rhizobium sp. WW_1]
MDTTTALQLCRFLHDSSLMLLWGACAYLSMFVPKTLADAVWRMIARSFFLITAIAVLTMLAALPVTTASIGNGWSDALDAGMVHDVLFETTVGTAWQAQALAALVMIGALLLPESWRRHGLALGAGLGLASLSLTGHASMLEGWLKQAHRANDILHVLTGGGWLGALVPLLPILRLLGRPEYRAEAQIALRRFSNAGHVAVALVILSGVINTLLILKRLPTDWSSPYQMLLAIKIALVAIMAVLAIVNRYVFVPWIGRKPARALLALRLGSIAEIVIGIVVIGLVAFFGMMEPV